MPVTHDDNGAHLPMPLRTGQGVDLRITTQMLEIYRNHERLTSHLLLPEHVINEYRTNDADQPPWPWRSKASMPLSQRCG